MHIRNISSKARAFINHKVFHPGSYRNIEQVWKAEQEDKAARKHARERLEVVKEEQRIEQLKGQLRKFEHQTGDSTVQQSVNGLDWMYQNPAESLKAAEDERLLGQVEAKPSRPIFDDMLASKEELRAIGKTQNIIDNVDEETLKRIQEDPLLSISQANWERKQKLNNNPWLSRSSLIEESPKLNLSDSATERMRYRLEKDIESLQTQIQDLRKKEQDYKDEIRRIKTQRHVQSRRREGDRMSENEKQKRLEEMSKAGAEHVNNVKAKLHEGKMRERKKEGNGK